MVPGIVEPCGDSKHDHCAFDTARRGGWLGNYASKWESICRNRRDNRFVARCFYCDSEVFKLSAQKGITAAFRGHSFSGGIIPSR